MASIECLGLGALQPLRIIVEFENLLGTNRSSKESAHPCRLADFSPVRPDFYGPAQVFHDEGDLRGARRRTVN